MDAFVWPVRVYYEDTDSGSLVYHANYLKFMERARTEWLRQLGFDQSRLVAELGMIFVVRAMGIEFIRPARLDDKLEIHTRVRECRGASLNLEQTVNRVSSNPERLIEASVKVACLDAGTLKPLPIPAKIKTEIQDVG